MKAKDVAADLKTLASLEVNDKEDLIHKALGWMLREVAERDVNALAKFLDEHGAVMPRTMLRYAIEHFDDNERKKYLVMSKRK